MVMMKGRLSIYSQKFDGHWENPCKSGSCSCFVSTCKRTNYSELIDIAFATLIDQIESYQASSQGNRLRMYNGEQGESSYT